MKLDLVVWPGVWHGWRVLVPLLPEGMQALRGLGEAICQRAVG